MQFQLLVFYYVLTILGINVDTKILDKEKQKIIIMLQDTAGQERFKKTIPAKVYQNANGVALFYDITNEQSFKNISNWLKTIAENTNEVAVVLIGNKSDLEEKRVIKAEEGRKIADENNFLFFETSVKANKNIDEAIDAVVDKLMMMKINAIKGIKLTKEKDNESKKEKSCCCGSKKSESVHQNI